MINHIDLRELAQLQGNGRDFVSVYFRGNEGIRSLDARERHLVSILEDDADELEHFQLSMQLIRNLLEKHPTQTPGVCVFACAMLDFVRGHPLALEVEPVLYVGPAPFIRPLAELQDEYQTFAVVACDNSDTRIYLVTEEAVEVEQRIKGGVKNKVRKGGWSQQRYARRREGELQRYAKDVAAALEELVLPREITRVVLAGSQETMLAIERELRPETTEKIVVRQAFDLNKGEGALVEEAYQAYFAQERHEEMQLWRQIRDEYKQQGLAAVGATAVLEALQQGRADTLILTRNLELKGTSCRDCEHVVHGTPQTCQSCGSKAVFDIDLVDELNRQAELTSARVEFSDPIDSLSKVGGVAALLRY
jgi:peptide subunit release factor 1 (eRF1)